jgi:cytochrome d ubiquinol oxidase subunit I
MFLGSWLSGYFIIVTNAFMQHPVGHAIGRNGSLELASFWAYLLNPWALWEYAHNMSASVITGSFVITAVGALYTLSGSHKEHAGVFLKVGVYCGLVFCLLQIFPTGDGQGKMVARHQPAALAAMEGKFQTGTHAEMVLIGQPDVKARRLENPIYVPGVLSFLAYGTFGATVKGLNDFPQDQWPDNVDLLYFSYHIMVGLGTIFIILMGSAAALQYRGKLQTSRPMLWLLMLAFPFPYIATTFGWMTAELGRQPWLVYGLQRTLNGTSEQVSGGNVAFSTLGFMGLYFVMGVLFLYLVLREIGRGPGGGDIHGGPGVSHNKMSGASEMGS